MSDVVEETSHVQKQQPRVFHHRLNLAQEGNCFSTVNESVVVRQCYVHHGTDFHLPKQTLTYIWKNSR